MNIKKIKLIDLKVESVRKEYQRDTEKIAVKKIIDTFDIDQLDPLVVNEDADGEYSIVDGLHRFSALKILNSLGLYEDSVYCRVVKKNTMSEESGLLIKMAKNRTSMKTLELFNSEVCEGREESVKIKKIVERVGAKIPKRNSSGSHCVSCVSTLKKVYNKFSGEHLENTLKTIISIYDFEKPSLSSEFIMGYAYFLNKFKNIDSVELARKMQMYPIMKLRNEAAQIRTDTTSGYTEAFVRAIVKLYNVKRQNKLYLD